MTSPEASDADVQEQQADVVQDGATAPDEVPDEASEADVAEQHRGLAVGEDDEVRDDAPEADVAEQRREVTLDEEDAPIG